MITILSFLIALLVVWELMFRCRNSKRIKSYQEFNSISRFPLLGSIFLYRYYKNGNFASENKSPKVNLI